MSKFIMAVLMGTMSISMWASKSPAFRSYDDMHTKTTSNIQLELVNPYYSPKTCKCPHCTFLFEQKYNNKLWLDKENARYREQRTERHRKEWEARRQRVLKLIKHCVYLTE